MNNFVHIYIFLSRNSDILKAFTFEIWAEGVCVLFK